MRNPPRVAFFTDAFHEANGVGTISREFAAFAGREGLPFFSVHAGPETRLTTAGTVTTLELRRGPLAFPLDRELRCDPFFTRYKDLADSHIAAFRPDLVHITGPGDAGILGAWVAHGLRRPLVASWHTNLQEYSSRRLDRTISWLPLPARRRISGAAERGAMNALTMFYSLARLVMAPNCETVALLERRTGRPAVLMQHGVDVDRFSPLHRRRQDSRLTLGYVGRLTPEKNVRALALIERELVNRGLQDFRLLLVGAGSEQEWLQANLRHAEFPGILRGPALAEAFAGMDVFLFPSSTDTFGLVILEAAASGVPAIVAPGGGPQHQVQPGETGFLARTPAEFAQYVLALAGDAALLSRMGQAARAHACACSWDSVFSQVYAAYTTLEALPRRVER